MPTQEEILKVVMQMHGKQDVDALSRAIAFQYEQLAIWKKQLDAGTLSQVAFDSRLAGVTAHVDSMSRSLKAAQKQAGDLAGGSRSAHNSLLMLGNTLDDLQYVGQNGMGLRPILNNIMQFAPKLGIALVGFELLRKGVSAVATNISAAMGGSLTGFLSDVDKAKAKLEDLNSTTFKTPEVKQEIQRAESRVKTAEVAKEFEGIRSTGDDERAANARAAAQANEGGGKGVKSMLQGLVGEQFETHSVEMLRESFNLGNNKEDNLKIDRMLDNQDPTARSHLRERVVGDAVNRIMEGLKSGDKKTAAEIIAMAENSSITTTYKDVHGNTQKEFLGERDDSNGPNVAGRFKNKAMRALEEGAGSDEFVDAVDQEIREAERLALQAHRKIAEKRFAKSVDEEIDDSERDADMIRFRRQQRAETAHRAAPFVSPLQSVYNGMASAGNTMDRDTAIGFLVSGGKSQDEAEQLADSLLKGLKKGFEKGLHELMLTDNLTEDEAKRRINAAAREKFVNARRHVLAEDLAAAATDEQARLARNNRRVRKLAPHDAKIQGELIQRQLEGMGLDPDEQAKAADMLKDRAKRPAMAAMFNSLFGQTGDMRLAMQGTMKAFDMAATGKMSLNTAFNRVSRGNAAADRKEFNAAYNRQRRQVNANARAARGVFAKQKLPSLNEAMAAAALGMPKLGEPAMLASNEASAKATDANTKASASLNKSVDRLTNTIEQGLIPTLG